MDLQLTDKRVLITGASKGIGLAVALAFAREGARPLMVSRSHPALIKAAEEVQSATGIQPDILAADIGTEAGARAVTEAFSDCDVLVNNAGAIPGGGLGNVGDKAWRDSWELKLYGYINLCRAILPAMQARRAGVIANIIGMAGAAPRAEYIAGSTANAALMAFTEALGARSPDDGVRVFGINPSPTRSDRMEAMLRSQAAQRFGEESRWMELTRQLPFGRLAEPGEVADLTVFGCSPRAGYLSGTVINLDGGQMYASPRV